MPRVPENIFREYDIRGDAKSELTTETIVAIGRAYGTFLQRKGFSRMVLGGDVRLSTERIRGDIINGVTSTGIDVIDLGVITTPMLYWSLFEFDVNGGIMITGSHNPKNMNGLKLACGKSTIYGDQIQEIRRIIEAGDYVSGNAGFVTTKSIEDDYLAMLKSKISLGSRKLKVVVDAGNGTAGPTIGRFLRSIGCEVVELFCEPDGNFPNHHPDPIKRENLPWMIHAIKKSAADVGLGFDGDADRIGVVDDRGNIVWGDILQALFWRDIMPKYPGSTGLVEVKCSQALNDEISRLGGNPLFYKSGHSLTKAKMKEVNTPFAGELSGHMCFSDEYYGFDDSYYAAARLLRILSKSGIPLSEMLSDMPVYYSTDELRVNCPDEKKFQVVEDLIKTAEKEYDIITVDGLRIIYPDKRGWGLIRASNTQPVLVTRCEGRSRADLEFIAADIKERLLNAGISNFEWTFSS